MLLDAGGSLFIYQQVLVFSWFHSESCCNKVNIFKKLCVWVRSLTALVWPFGGHLSLWLNFVVIFITDTFFFFWKNCVSVRVRNLTSVCSRPFGGHVFMRLHSTHHPYGSPSQATFIIHTILSQPRIGSSSPFQSHSRLPSNLRSRWQLVHDHCRSF